MRIKLIVSYDGTAFYGWQLQENQRTVQEELEKALFDLLGVKTRVTGSGRTDSGVHALAQVCTFDTSSTIPPEKYPECLNFRLPDDVKVLSSERAADDFDCTRHAKKKTYRYSLYLSDRTQPLKERYSVKIPVPVSVEKMRTAAYLLEGEHDFKAFCASGSTVKTTVRTIYIIQIEERKDFFGSNVDVYVTGNGFLYKMVRSLVGLLVEIGAGKKSAEDLLSALETGDRESIGRTLPAKGLTLYSVEYEE